MFRNIKNLFILLCLLMMSMIAYSDVKAPSKVTFDGEVYKQSSKEGDGIKTYLYVEYLRKGETINNYKKLVAIWECPNDKDVKKFAQSLMNDEKYPNFESGMTVSKDGSEVVVNYIIGHETNQQFNIFRVMKRNGHVVAYQYIYSNYTNMSGKNNKEWVKWIDNIKQNKSRWIDEINKANYIN